MGKEAGKQMSSVTFLKEAEWASSTSELFRVWSLVQTAWRKLKVSGPSLDLLGPESSAKPFGYPDALWDPMHAQLRSAAPNM